MITKVTFTEKERDTLTDLLLRRLSFYNETHLPKARIINNLVSAMFKIEESASVRLKDLECIICRSVINEKLSFLSPENTVDISENLFDKDLHDHYKNILSQLKKPVI